MVIDERMDVLPFAVPRSGDLHLHTLASDGVLPAEEMVRLARRRGADFVAVTDHDSLQAVAAARRAGRQLGIPVLSGVEVSARWRGHDQHLLVYGLDPVSPLIDEFLLSLQQARRRRMEAMLSRLADMGVSLSWQHVAAELPDPSTPPCRPHLARALCRSGAVSTTQEAFIRWIGDDAPAFVAHEETLDMDSLVEFSRARGGVTILAHPASGRSDEPWIDPELLDRVDGLEVFHPGHCPQAVLALTELARSHGLLMTGGSDAHDGQDVMRCTTGAEDWQALIRRIDQRGGLV